MSVNYTQSPHVSRNIRKLRLFSDIVSKENDNVNRLSSLKYLFDEDSNEEILLIGTSRDILIAFNIETEEMRSLELFPCCYGIESMMPHRYDGKWYVILGAFKKLIVVDLRNLTVSWELRNIELLTDSVYDGVSLSEDRFCSISERHSLVWDFGSREVVFDFDQHKYFLGCVHKLKRFENVMVSGCDENKANTRLIHFNFWTTGKHIGSLGRSDQVLNFLRNNTEENIWSVNSLSSLVKRNGSEILIVNFRGIHIALFDISCLSNKDLFNEKLSSEEEIPSFLIPTEVKLIHVVDRQISENPEGRNERIWKCIVHPTTRKLIIFSLFETDVEKCDFFGTNTTTTTVGFNDKLSVVETDTENYSVLESLHFKISKESTSSSSTTDYFTSLSNSAVLKCCKDGKSKNYNSNSVVYCGTREGTIVEWEISERLLSKGSIEMEDEKERVGYLFLQLLEIQKSSSCFGDEVTKTSLRICSMDITLFKTFLYL